MNRNYETQNLGVVRPVLKHKDHELVIKLIGRDGHWSTILDLDLEPSAPAQFYLIELQTKTKREGSEVRRVSETESEFVVNLDGDTAPAVVKNLSNLPSEKWMVAMFEGFAAVPAAIGVLVARGKVSVTVSGEGL